MFDGAGLDRAGDGPRTFDLAVSPRLSVSAGATRALGLDRCGAEPNGESPTTRSPRCVGRPDLDPLSQGFALRQRWDLVPGTWGNWLDLSGTVERQREHGAGAVTE